MNKKYISLLIIILLFSFSIVINAQIDSDTTDITIKVGKYALVEFTENLLFTDNLEGHTGLYYSDGNITAQRAKVLWGDQFENEKRKGGHAAFDVVTNTPITVSLESFRKEDLNKAEYNWVDSPTLFAVSDGGDNWATRAQIYRNGTEVDKLIDDFDMTLSSGAYKDRFRIGAAVWISQISELEAGDYLMPLYITVAASE